MNHDEIRKKIGQASMQCRNHTDAIQALVRVCEGLLDEIERLELEIQNQDYSGDL